MATRKQKIRPFLKWPGGKFHLLDILLEHLPAGNKLVEPFAGSCALFLNTNYDHYKLNDINSDIIDLYQILQTEGKNFIDHASQFFTSKNNKKEIYYKLRKQFNASNDLLERSALFIYLNRHCYNGLVRYNLGKGEFNVPFGQYKAPYFPKKEMLFFHKKSKNVEFTTSHFRDSLKYLKKETVVYCDPPYVPISTTANFTQYAPFAFKTKEQEELANLAKNISARNIKILISNHANAYARKLYQGSRIIEFSVPRFISCKARKPAKELLAIY